MQKGIVDLDNVVSEWLDWVMSQQKSVPKLTGLRSGRLDEMWDLTEKEVIDLVDDLRGYTDAEVVPGAYEGLWRLYHHPDVDFIYLSAAPKHALQGRVEWLERHGLPWSSLTHLGKSGAKINWLMDHGSDYDFIIDDSLDHLDAALFAGIPLRMAFHRPWNQQENGENHIRVDSWRQAIGLILSQ